MKNSFKELEKVDYEGCSVRVLKFIRYAEKRCFPLHWHDRIELLRIDRGMMSVSCGNTDFTAKEGDCVVINPKEVHSAIAVNGDVEYTCVMFELAPLSGNIYYGQSHITPLLYRQLRFKNCISDGWVNWVIETLEDLCKLNSPTDVFRIDAQALLLLSHLFEYYVDQDYTVNNSDLQFTEVLDYIDYHYDDDITIPFLSQKFGYDSSYFCRKFKAQTGITCIEYINALRLDHAAILLKGTNSAVNEISANCGFSDPNYFSRCFKEKYGVSPSKWRER